MPAKLKYGVIGAPGGKREGAGRKPEWLIIKCQEIIDRVKLVEFLGQVVAGEDVEQAVGDQGEVIRITPAVRDRLRAAEILLDRGYGKPAQQVDVSIDSSELESFPTRNLLEVFAAFEGGTVGPVEARA